MEYNRPIQERFWEKVNKTKTCWIWTSQTVKGYGHFRIKNKKSKQLAHRLSWAFCIGPIPNNTCVLHKCDNPSCVNPDHLFLGSKGDNNADRAKKNRNADTCGEKHPCNKLTDLDVKLIRKIGKKKVITQTQLGKIFNVSQSQISLILLNKEWTHI